MPWRANASSAASCAGRSRTKQRGLAPGLGRVGGMHEVDVQHEQDAALVREAAEDVGAFRLRGRELGRSGGRAARPRDRAGSALPRTPRHSPPASCRRDGSRRTRRCAPSPRAGRSSPRSRRGRGRRLPSSSDRSRKPAQLPPAEAPSGDPVCNRRTVTRMRPSGAFGRDDARVVCAIRKRPRRSCAGPASSGSRPPAGTPSACTGSCAG